LQIACGGFEVGVAEQDLNGAEITPASSKWVAKACRLDLGFAKAYTDPSSGSTGGAGREECLTPVTA
jgi:hypothetical protein